MNPAIDVVVINLASEPRRWLAMQAQFAALGLRARRMEAVAGRDLQPHQRAALYSEALNRRQYHQPLCPGEIGCYASHLALWRALVDSPAECMAVFEDDMAPAADLPVVLRALAHLPGCWDMVKLIGRARSEKLAAARPFASGRQLVRYRRVPSLTGAYVVHRRGAQKLLSRRLPFGRPVDVDLRHWWECDLDLFGVWPYPVQAAPAAHRSTIEDRQRVPRDAASRWRRLVQQAGYSLHNWQARQRPPAASDDGSPPPRPAAGGRSDWAQGPVR
ncbi:glycosyltransferase family 25 protein [Aquabacterium sp. J223]|uniref:glycosyltransferase family 25 protein n=1 Tax=Aquabacterium sp. J223 TaxID=2898431 RepID=UPI00289CBD3D|nr:glycosyltransferase family 25 protein [Aquabacterium sp. J223]